VKSWQKQIKNFKGIKHFCEEKNKNETVLANEKKSKRKIRSKWKREKLQGKTSSACNR
jgi:hypothetical protein